MSASLQRRVVNDTDSVDNHASTEREVLAGLMQQPKRISPKYFYDQKGSALFDAITGLDEYYLPRVEKEIFSRHGAEMCAVIGKGAAVIEPGAGSCEKIKSLLPELQPSAYVPMDISGEHLQASAASFSDEYPGIPVVPQVCDHTQGMDISIPLDGAPAVFFYPGSSVGNFEPDAAVDFLCDMRALINDRGGLLIGVDAKKDESVLHAAYNDADGVTAQFNVNVLDNLNRLLDGNIDRRNFVHHALYNDKLGRIEMHLKCMSAHSARLAGCRLEFAEGELIHTENSYKYHPDEFIALAERAGFMPRQLWQDQRRWFSVMYFEPA